VPPCGAPQPRRSELTLDHLPAASVHVGNDTWNQAPLQVDGVVRGALLVTPSASAASTPATDDFTKSLPRSVCVRWPRDARDGSRAKLGRNHLAVVGAVHAPAGGERGEQVHAAPRRRGGGSFAQRGRRRALVAYEDADGLAVVAERNREL
jgi:hypothetical protein